MAFIYPISIFSSIVFSILMFTRRKQSLGFLFLSLYFIFRSIDLVYDWSLYYRYDFIYTSLLWIIFSTSIFKSILLYLFIGFLVHKIVAINRKIFRHLIPIFLKYLLVIFCFAIFRSHSQFNIFEFTNTLWYGDLFYYVTISIVAFYIVLSLRLINVYHNSFYENESNTHKLSLGWLKVLIFGEIALHVFYFLIRILDLGELILKFNYYPILDLVDFILLMILGVMAYRQGHLSSMNYDISYYRNARNVMPTNTSDKTTGRTKIKSKEATRFNDYIGKIDEYMEKESAFLNSDLSISIMARDLHIPVNILSKCINSHYNKTFFDFVNSYRVQALIEKAKTEENSRYTLIGLAYDCGFNSKTTFNRVFKKHTGETPSNYFKKAKMNHRN